MEDTQVYGAERVRALSRSVVDIYDESEGLEPAAVELELLVADVHEFGAACEVSKGI